MPTRTLHPRTTDRLTSPDQGSCLGRTCLNWRANGELYEDDMALVMQRLLAVDAPTEPGVVR